MKKSKKFISLLIALQLLGSMLIPAYAENDEAVTFNETYIASSDEPDNEGASKDSDRVIIKFKDDKTKEKFKKSKNKKIKNKVKGEKDFEVKNNHYSVVTVNEGENIDEFIQSIGDEYSEEIEMIQPDYIIGSFSNEPAIVVESVDIVEEADTAENVDTVEETVDTIEEVVTYDGTAETDIIVAMIDTAIDYDHKALADSIYFNQNEELDGIDNDENGYIDDVYGWDFIKGSDISTAEFQTNHGTHVVGLIAAEGIGVGTNAKILPLNVFNEGIAYTSDIIAAIEYAENAGAKIVNCSWGSSDNNPALEEAISSSDMLFVCAAGNNGVNIDENPVYPAAYELDNVISVGASNDRDYLTYFSNYGDGVDVAANGYKVYSTFVNNNYGTMMGTSMSTAYVSGVAAATYADSAIETKNVILNTCDRISSLDGLINNARRVSYDNAILGVVNNSLIENTNIDYDEERYQQIINNSENYELLDLDAVPTRVSAGSNHSLVSDSYGYAYSFGDNTYYQLGTKGTNEFALFNNHIEGLLPVSDISTYANHNLALVSGKVYAWGDNSRYQIGVTYNDAIGVPEEVELFNDDGTVPTIVDVEAGGWYSLALDSNNNLWAWGDNKYGQFSNGSTNYRSATARIIQNNVSVFSAGKYHVLAIVNGVVKGWGRSGDDYALGETASYSQATALDIQGLPDNIVDVEAGDTCSFFITSDGEVYAMGLNSDGRLGDGTNTTRSVPTLLPITGVKDVESNGTTLFLLENGDVYACGPNDYGQIGQGYTNTRYETASKVPGSAYDAITSGGNHNLLYTSSDYPVENEYASVYAIGRNNYGQCISSTEGNMTYPEVVIDMPYPDDLGPFAWDSNHLRPVDATYISQNSENGSTNFYGELSAKVCYTPSEYDSSNWGKYAYFKFDTSNISNEQIASAKLHIYVENAGDMRESTREIGVYTTCENDWDGENITWNNGLVRSKDLLGIFEVTGTGYIIEDPGWREIDITEYLKNSIDSELSVMLKMISGTAHEIQVTSGIYTGDEDSTELREKKNIPVLEIQLEQSGINRSELYPIDDTYIYQNGNSRYLNFANEEYLSITHTPDSTRTDYWGQDAILNFNTSNISKEYIDKATLWVYVDESSDTRKSTREIEVTGNTPSRKVSNIVTWDLDRSEGDALIGNFTVTGNGYDILDSGWKCIDVTDFIRNSTDTIDIIMQMTDDQHRVNIRSIDHANEETRPRIVIDISNNDEIELFDVYKFDEDVNVYKKSVLNICDELYYNDLSIAKQMYSEYEDILDDDAKLHTLPDSLSDHPKDLEGFDSLLNQYYMTKYDEFISIKERYIALIDKYSVFLDTEETMQSNEVLLLSDEETTENYAHPIIGKFYPQSIVAVDTNDDISGNSLTPYSIQEDTPENKPSLTIVNTTSTSVTYNAVFPVSGANGNAMSIVDFNTDDGLTTCCNLYEDDTNRTDGQYTISNLSPGGIYFLQLCWSTDGGSTYGGENSIWRYVQLPDDSSEELTLYSGGRIDARMEAKDKELASESDFNTWLERMDQAYYAFKDLTGYTPYDSKKIEMRSTRENLNESQGIVDGLHYWWVCFGTYSYTNMFKHSSVFNRGHMRRLSMGDWGDIPMHELSHVFDNENWIFDEETLSQFKLYYVVEQLNAKVYRPDRYDNNGKGWYTGSNYYDLLKHDRYLDSYDASFGNGNYASEGFAAVLIEVQKEIGWEPFKKTFRYFNNLTASQIPDEQGEILKLFLTKLKDYSGEDVLSLISSYDTGIIEEHFDVTLEYVEPIYPTVSGNSSSGEGNSEVTATGGSYSIYQFTPEDSETYYIYTSPYSDSGVSNDTYIEVYNNSSLSGTPLVSNDDYGDSRFSKVSIAMTEGATYYIKIRHYNDGQVHAKLNITKNIPIVELSLDEYEDIKVASGEFALYSFTPTKSITHVFEVTNYNGGVTEYNTYIKLYSNESMTQCVGYDSKKILTNLNAGQTYYLQFSGFLMKSSRGRISVREGQTLEFTKSTDSSFIYVNSPEYITKYDIVDEDSLSSSDKEANKIFEQTGITGKGTYFQTHLSWYGASYDEAYYPQQSFYLDVDFYNESAKTVTLEINNLAYGLNYQVMGDYYKGGGYTYTIESGKHLLLFKTLNAPLLVSNSSERPTILFDFKVSDGSVTVSSLAAYEIDNLYLKDYTFRTLLFNDKELNRGYPELKYASTRPDEQDYNGKYKGTAWNESAWIDANIEFLIDENTQIGEAQPIYLKDDFYDTIANPKWSWTTALNPIDDDSYGTLSAMPGALHSFKYPSEYDGKEWYFDFTHHDLSLTDTTGSGSSVNTEVSADAISELKSVVAQGKKRDGYTVDSNALSMGSWGATHHYTITVTNTTDSDRIAVFGCRKFNNMTFGYKQPNENSYTTDFNYGTGSGDDDWWEPVEYTVPANGEITFEVVTTLGVSFGGTNYRFVVR